MSSKGTAPGKWLGTGKWQIHQLFYSIYEFTQPTPNSKQAKKSIIPPRLMGNCAFYGLQDVRWSRVDQGWSCHQEAADVYCSEFSCSTWFLPSWPHDGFLPSWQLLTCILGFTSRLLYASIGELVLQRAYWQPWLLAGHTGLLMRTLLHLADISNPAKPLYLAKIWQVVWINCWKSSPSSEFLK